ncbi:INO80 complex subunit 1 [Colletotrichum spaethianum]|uniref:INO80 complex subunit 1 n=1 Tax=Colletotrichum spaethianum TaxID=700344 RepID=A0AA37L8Z3_9PEZI|nr:INO80 complex subunit 1 [Colletotrichum spaethianum]GKT42255.1 INO80 complex subunit 1 [Colletotrichum spaethianum]
MARGDSTPPESPLSSMDNSDASDEEVHDYEDESLLRPSKRQKLGAASTTSPAVAAEPEPEAVPEPDPLDGMSDVSSDTSGDIPSSPINAKLDEEDFQEQVTACAWEGCDAGDFGNMDKLVDHIHSDHIESRQKKYTCEWIGCNRKSMGHASGYALKAHMRSHTREKPFYCYLPECDRSFTRSDALAKHMRTVHETEALRPSDPVPKSMQAGPTGKGKLKIIIKTPQSHAAGQDDAIDDGVDDDELSADLFTPLTEEQGFTPEELKIPLEKLYKLCRFQVKWAQEESAKLAEEVKYWEKQYKDLWREKEVLFSQVVKSEVDWHERRQAVLSGAADVQLSGVLESQEGNTAATNGDGADSQQGSSAKETLANGTGSTEVAAAS